MRKMLASGVVEPSSSPYCAPLLIVRRSDGSNRPVADLRFMEKAPLFNAEPMPNPEAIFASLSGDNFKFFKT